LTLVNLMAEGGLKRTAVPSRSDLVQVRHSGQTHFFRQRGGHGHGHIHIGESQDELAVRGFFKVFVIDHVGHGDHFPQAFIRFHLVLDHFRAGHFAENVGGVARQNVNEFGVRNIDHARSLDPQ
jgi:hypothetical protein